MEAAEARASRLVGLRQARRVLSTSVLFANGPTPPVKPVTRLVIRAIFVVLAHHRHARHHRRPLRARGADAVGPVCLHNALGSVTAVLCGTRVQAVAVDARFVVHAIAIGLAAG